MRKIYMTIQCKSCDGTGVYVGMGEREGAAVVCHTCKGTGEYLYKFEYENFTGLKERKGVKRVYKDGYGFVISPDKLTFSGIGEIDMEREGVSYSEFKNGVMPAHIKQLACPMLADQGACHNIKGFIDECNRLNGSSLLGMWLKDCKNQPNKLECWKRFHKEEMK